MLRNGFQSFLKLYSIFHMLFTRYRQLSYHAHLSMTFLQESSENEVAVKMNCCFKKYFNSIWVTKQLQNVQPRCGKKFAIMSENIWAIHHHMMHICFFVSTISVGSFTWYGTAFVCLLTCLNYETSFFLGSFPAFNIFAK